MSDEPLTIGGLWERQVARGGDAIGLACAPVDGAATSHTWRDLGARVDAVAQALAATISPGERVGVHLANGLDFFVAWFALAKLGATIVPLNLRYAPDEIGHALAHARAVALISATEFPADVPSLRKRITPPFSGGSSPFADRGAPDDDAVILYTSGTTSRPKGVRLSHRACALAAARVAADLSLTRDDRFAVCAPMFHVNAQLWSILPAVAAGASILLMDRFSRSRWLDVARTHGATVASLISAMIRLLLDAPPSPRDREHALRLVGCATRWRAVEERFGVATLGWYGMTETVGPCIVSNLTTPFGVVGRARAPYAARVIAGERPASPDEPGELHVRGEPGRDLFSGYLDDDEATRAALSARPDGTWLRTGDLVRRDGDGWITYLGRARDLIRRGGENVSAAEVERALAEHPSVREAAVIALPDPLLDQRVAAAVILRDGATVTPDALRAFCAARLADFKVPSEIRIVDELPRVTLDKINKAALRACW